MRRVFLIGPAGVGKSTCGALLAPELGFGFVDLDAEFNGRVGDIGEFIAAKAGLGFYILNASGAFNINGIWVGVILIVALVFILTTAIGIVERRVLRWLPDLGSGRFGI